MHSTSHNFSTKDITELELVQKKMHIRIREMESLSMERNQNDENSLPYRRCKVWGDVIGM